VPRDLRCPDCGARHPDRWRCHCGAPLSFADPPLPDGPPPDPGGFDLRAGLWSFDAFLPVGDDPADRVTLGEGPTPLVDADAWDAAFKLEYVAPTGSFKDRGATTTLTRARELGVDRVVEDSSGNAGAAIATYAARAGIDASIYVPADAKAGKLRAIERADAEPVRVEGSRADVTDACLAAVRGDAGPSAWYASHAWHPAFLAGTATFAYEVAAQRDWTAPDAVVLPIGHGTLFLGAARGFDALERAGWIDAVPRLLGAQAAGVAPIARAVAGGEGPDDPGDPADPDGRAAAVADGIRIAEPARRREILDAVDATDGDAIAVGADAIERGLDRLHAAGFYTEPTCAVAPAALRAYRDRGLLDPDADVVVPLTGSGLKT